ncbi:Phenazine biosynthesis PhzF protein [Penicillium rubens]|jgi:hypothetical protein|nr:Phenazine biosynthesis PhzF protein [Penicillium rubens]KAJ5839227.1 Phenazine biosynthesis PhzF protein [Penicillium rubens]KAJ5867280.1 Phenazine biosynthesis PhzF protein [Penicillium rubens]
MEEAQVHYLRAVPEGPGGNDPLLIMPDAKEMSSSEMRGLPRLPQSHGHMTMTGFVFPTRAADRFWNPSYELPR